MAEENHTRRQRASASHPAVAGGTGRVVAWPHIRCA